MERGALGDLRVVEVAGSAAGAWAGKLFAGLGAEVVKVEPPRGDPLRRWGEPWHDGTGTLSAYLDTSKDSMLLDLDDEADRDRLAAVLAGADVAIESSAPDPLHPVTPGLGHTGLVTVLVSPFGLTGPHAGYRSTSLTDEAASGHLYLTGDPDRAPLQGAALQSDYAAGAFAFVGAMAALWARRRSGQGQTVEVSHVEAMVALHQFTFVKHTHGGEVLRRLGNRYAGPFHPIGGYACSDGWVSLSAPNGAMVKRLLAVTGLDHLLDRPDVSSVADLQFHPNLVDDALRPWMAARTVDEAVTALQAERVPVGPTLTMGQVLADDHLAAREFWCEVGGLRHPGPPFRLGRHRWQPNPAPAPGGLHADEAADRWAPSAGSPFDEGGEDGGEGPATDAGATTEGPLAGIRVLDLTRVWAGPLAARILADLGADVVMVEAPWARGKREVTETQLLSTRFYPDNVAGDRPWNRNGFLNQLALNKRSVTLELNDPAGLVALERLVGGVDVLMENYSARVMPKLGLDEDRLHELNPSLVYVTMPGYGRTGPGRDRVAYGNVLDGYAGMTSLAGYPGEHPWKSGIAWPDAVAGIHAAAATLVALWDREHDRDRRGDTVEVAQLETVVATLGHEVLAAQVRGADRPPVGNRHPRYAPQGVYPCRGDDRWIAVSVTDDEAWAGLCQLAGLADEAQLTVAERRAAHDRLDDALARFTRDHGATELMHRLQAVGVAAAAVLDAPGVMDDPHLAGSFVALDHPDTGPMPYSRLPVRLSATPATYRRPAPGLGEHAEEVLRSVGGLDAGEVADLVQRGVVTEGPPG